MSEIAEDKVIETLRKAFDREAEGEIQEAIRLFKIAAKLGSNDARSKLGTIFDDVLKPPKPDRAVYWYKQGAKNGCSGCAWNLAMHYAGLGRKRGYSYWLLKAQFMGDSDADEELMTGAWWKKRNRLKSH
jgi:TPR repeat protein